MTDQNMHAAGPTQDGRPPQSPAELADDRSPNRKTHRNRRRRKRKTAISTHDGAVDDSPHVDAPSQSRASRTSGNETVCEPQKINHACNGDVENGGQPENPRHLYEDYGIDIVSEFYAEETAAIQYAPQGETALATQLQLPLGDVHDDDIVGDTDDRRSEAVTTASPGPNDSVSRSCRKRCGRRRRNRASKLGDSVLANCDDDCSGVGVETSRGPGLIPHDNQIMGRSFASSSECIQGLGTPFPHEKKAENNQDVSHGSDDGNTDMLDGLGDSRERKRYAVAIEDSEYENAPEFDDLWCSLILRRIATKDDNGNNNDNTGWVDAIDLDPACLSSLSSVDRSGDGYALSSCGTLNAPRSGTDAIEDFIDRTKRRAALNGLEKEGTKLAARKLTQVEQEGEEKNNVNSNDNENSEGCAIIPDGAYAYLNDALKIEERGNLANNRAEPVARKKTQKKATKKAKRKAKKKGKKKADQLEKAADSENSDVSDLSDMSDMSDLAVILDVAEKARKAVKLSKGEKAKQTAEKIDELKKLGYDKKGRPVSTLFGKPVAGGNRGFDMLRKMGWKEGEGLGMNAKGALEPLAVDLRLGQHGIGGIGRKGKDERKKKADESQESSKEDEAEKEKATRRRKPRNRLRGLRESPAHVFEVPHTDTRGDTVSQSNAGDATGRGKDESEALQGQCVVVPLLGPQ